MSTAIVAKRSLLELARLRGLLDGSISPEEVGATGKTDGGARRQAALAIVDALGAMFSAVLDSAALAEGVAYRVARGQELVEGQEGQHQQPEREPFGFARHRRDLRCDAA